MRKREQRHPRPKDLYDPRNVCLSHEAFLLARIRKPVIKPRQGLFVLPSFFTFIIYSPLQSVYDIRFSCFRVKLGDVISTELRGVFHRLDR